MNKQPQAFTFHFFGRKISRFGTSGSEIWEVDFGS